jgi:hypothetical protein
VTDYFGELFGQGIAILGCDVPVRQHDSQERHPARLHGPDVRPDTEPDQIRREASGVGATCRGAEQRQTEDSWTRGLCKTLGDHPAQRMTDNVRRLNPSGVHDRQCVLHHLIQGDCSANRLAVADPAIIKGDAAEESAEFRDLRVPARPMNPDALDENNRRTFAQRSP